MPETELHNNERNGKPLVSVCCITYNQEAYIRDCLEGFMMQKMDFPFEVLIHDDASTDRTADIIREYEAKYPSIVKPICQKENQHSKGLPINLTFNYPRVQGKYIALCEGDDYWTDPLKLQKQFDFMESHPDYSGCFHNAIQKNEKTGSRELYLKKPIKKDLSISDILCNNGCMPTASVFFRAEFIKDISEYRKSAPVGDLPLEVCLADKGKVKYLDETMAVYRLFAAGSWSDRMAGNTEKAVSMFQRQIAWLDELAEMIHSQQDIDRAKGHIYIKMYELTRDYESIRNNKYAGEYLKTCPFPFRLKLLIKMNCPFVVRLLDRIKKKG